MPSFAPSTSTITLLRHIPETVLYALVKRDDYRSAVVAHNAPLPETVFEYLFNEYALVKPRDLLYARPLTGPQRALMLQEDLSPSIQRMIVERFFKYNTLTHDELRALKPDMLTEKAAMDLIRRHRHDLEALGLIINRLPQGTIIRIANPGITPGALMPRYGESKVAVADLVQYLRGIVDMEIETAESYHPPFPLHTAIGDVGYPKNVEQVKSYLKSGLAISPFNADPITSLLGEAPLLWLNFLNQLDSAGPSATAYQVAMTVIRTRRKSVA